MATNDCVEVLSLDTNTNQVFFFGGGSGENAPAEIGITPTEIGVFPTEICIAPAGIDIIGPMILIYYQTTQCRMKKYNIQTKAVHEASKILSEVVLGTVRTRILEELASGTSRDVTSGPTCSWTGILEGLASGTFRDVPSSPSFHGTIRTGILEGLASGTS